MDIETIHGFLASHTPPHQILLDSGTALFHSSNETTEDCQPNIDPSRRWSEWFGSLMQIHFDEDTWRLYVTANNLEREEGVKQC